MEFEKLNATAPTHRWRLIGLVATTSLLFVIYTVWIYRATNPGVTATSLGNVPDYVVGTLGGMKVRIPAYCAADVEYDGDPGFGEKPKHAPGPRTLDSNLQAFGIEARYPEMSCMSGPALRADRRKRFLDPNNPWIGIIIQAGGIYPSSGAEAADRLAKSVVDTVEKPTPYWSSNYQPAASPVDDLEAYVVAGIDPNSGKPARDSDRTKDVFIHRSASGMADTYLECSKTYVPGGVATCAMRFGLEPRAKVSVQARFVRSRLPQWRDIRKATADLLTGFEIHYSGSDDPRPLVPQAK